jgi:4-hydroxybenzoate polyprenyltransferase
MRDGRKRDRVLPLLKQLRSEQWTKNLAAFAGVIFGGRILQPDAIVLDLLVFGIFVLASAATYLVNDICDLDHDRQHPTKRLRPLASGQVPLFLAKGLAVVLAVSALVVAGQLNGKTLACVGAYLLTGLAYSLTLKHFPLLDVTCIAFGYVFRVLAGIYVLEDIPTAWITLCTFFLALFLAVAKRRAEFVSHETSGPRARPALERYSRNILDALLNSSATMTIMSYALFTATSGKNASLIITVPIVYYATAHYMRLVLDNEHGEEPARVLLRDRTIQISIVLWLACFIGIFYGDVSLFR